MNNNFNIGQFVSNFLNFSAKTVAGKQVNNIATVFEQAATAMPKEVLANQNLQLKNMVEIPKLQLEMLDTLDKGALVKELMNLPKDFPQLISMFTSQAGANQTALLDVSKLIAFIQQNGEVGKQNLLNLIVSINKSGFTHTEQLKELSYIINACMPSNQNSTATVMKNLILLYLPWLPLGEGAGFDIDIPEKNEETSGEEDDSVMIYIQTLNFGSIKVILKVEGKTKILLQINCDESFPKNIAQKRFMDEVESYNIKSEFSFSQQNQDEKKESLEKVSQTRVNVNTSRHINPLLMMASHSIIRIVFEIDKNLVEVNSDSEKEE